MADFKGTCLFITIRNTYSLKITYSLKSRTKRLEAFDCKFQYKVTFIILE